MNTEKPSVAHNVDHNEIAKFEAVASRWWDLEGEFKPLHRINPLRLGYITERSGGLFGKKVLDVGCGGGILAESMAREGATVTGLDMGFEPLQVAKLHALESGIEVEYVQETVEEHAAKHAQHTTSSPVWKCWSTFPIRNRSSTPAPNWLNPAARCSSQR